MAANDPCNQELFGTADQTKTANEAYDSKHGQYQCLEVPRTDGGAAPQQKVPFKTRGG